MHFFRTDLLKGNLWSQTLIFFVPILIGSFFQQLYNTVDAIVVGRFVGPIALGAVGGSTAVLVNLFIGVFIGVASGSAVVLSHAVGANDQRAIHDTIHTSMALAIVASIFITIVGILLAPSLLHLVNVPETMFNDALVYLRIYFVGTIFSLVYNMGTALLRAMGDNKRPLYFLMASCLTNIILDVWFVMGLGWGVAGAAIATVMSQVVSGVLVVIVMMHYDGAYTLNFKDIRFNRNLLKRMLWIGFPAGAQSALYTISNLVVQASANSFGETISAAYAAYGKIDAIYWMIVGALGTTITTVVGQNYGAKQYDRVQKSVYISWLYAAIVSLFCSVVFIIFGQYIFALFTTEPIVIDSGMMITRVIAPWFIAYCTIEIIAGAYRGVGNVLIPTALTLVGVVGIRVVWIMMNATASNVGIPLLCYPLSWTITSILFILYFFVIKKGKVS